VGIWVSGKIEYLVMRGRREETVSGSGFW